MSALDGEEDDYLDSKFLTEKDHSPPRRSKLAPRASTKQSTKQKALGLLEEENRTIGLETALPETNKGFKMMAKLGYRPGTGLGTTSNGIVEPISVEIRTKKEGLGSRDTAKFAIPQLTAESVAEFKARLGSQFAEKKLQAQIVKAQNVAEELDAGSNLEGPSHYYNQHADPEDEADVRKIFLQKPPTEQLLQILLYLRPVHKYCLWCAIRFTDDEDMNKTCPGLLPQDHDE